MVPSCLAATAHVGVFAFGEVPLSATTDSVSDCPSSGAAFCATSAACWCHFSFDEISPSAASNGYSLRSTSNFSLSFSTNFSLFSTPNFNLSPYATSDDFSLHSTAGSIASDSNAAFSRCLDLPSSTSVDSFTISGNSIASATSDYFSLLSTADSNISGCNAASSRCLDLSSSSSFGSITISGDSIASATIAGL